MTVFTIRQDNTSPAATTASMATRSARASRPRRPVEVICSAGSTVPAPHVNPSSAPLGSSAGRRLPWRSFAANDFKPRRADLNLGRPPEAQCQRLTASNARAPRTCTSCDNACSRTQDARRPEA